MFNVELSRWFCYCSRMEWLRRLGRNRLWDVTAACLGVWATVRLFLPTNQNEGYGDFKHYYIAAHVMNTGGDPYKTSLGALYPSYGFGIALDQSGFVAQYPPPFLWLMSPLARLEPRPAYMIWMAGEFVALGVILGLSLWLLREQLSWRGRWLLVAAVMTSAPLYWHFVYAQLGLLLAALVLTGYVCHRQGWMILGGIAVACAGLLKLFPFALLPWFVWRGPGGWKGRVVRLMAVSAFILAIVFATGVERWLVFHQNALAVVAENSANTTFNYTIPTLLINLRLALSDYVVSSETGSAWLTIGTLAGLLWIAGAYALCWFRGGAADVEFSLLSMAMVAGGVRANGHYFVLLFFPVAVAVLRVCRSPTVGRVIGVGVLLLAMNMMASVSSPTLDRHLVLKVLSNNIPLYGLLGLTVWLVREQPRPGGQ